MQRIRILGGLALSIGLAAIFSGAMEAGVKKSDSEVKITTESGKADSAGRRLISVHIAINPGWYIYANPVGNKDFESAQTSVKVLSGGKEIDAKVAYPAGKIKDVELIGKLSTYQGKVTITAEAPAGEVTLHVRVQTCHEKGVCLIPATVKLNVP